MAFPIIDSVTAVPNIVQPGGTFVVTVLAHDPDALGPITLKASVKDAAGNDTPVDVVVTVSDPMTYTLSGPPGFTFTPRAGSPNVFDCKAP
jgi:hypothetical protein